jgi:hypothetical protein
MLLYNGALFVFDCFCFVCENAHLAIEIKGGRQKIYGSKISLADEGA